MEDGDYSPAVPNVAVPVALAYVYPLGYGARSVWANEGGRGGVHSAHGDQRGTDSANQCRAGAPRRGFFVRRSLVDHGGTGCTGDRHKYTGGSSWLPLSRLSWTVLGAQRTSRGLAEVPGEHRISSFLVSMRRVLWPRIGALRYLEVPTPLSPGVVPAQASYINRYAPGPRRRRR
jgi:hypothetical protein